MFQSFPPYHSRCSYITHYADVYLRYSLTPLSQGHHTTRIPRKHLLLTWCLQQVILNHPVGVKRLCIAVFNSPRRPGQVTGWTLTHCGQNSTTGALAQGIPMSVSPKYRWDKFYIMLPLNSYPLLKRRSAPQRSPSHAQPRRRIWKDRSKYRAWTEALHRGVKPTGTVEAVMSETHSILQRAR